MLSSLIRRAHAAGASDLHLEPGLPVGLRVRGKLSLSGQPVDGSALLAAARDLIGAEGWPDFLSRRSYDLSRVLGGAQCRVNILQSTRGVGMAIRLLSAHEPTLAQLNLHLDLRQLVARPHGLVLICGPTGSGKSSTLAALVEEVNRSEARHIVTVESPIEIHFRPKKAFIRQREVGRDTPSFEQALLDALREDPDVLVVGEMRRPETMQLTLDAAETGHLVLATMHASTPGEALQRIIAAFPSDGQAGVRAQLASCFAAALSQRLIYRRDAGQRVPECEVLTANAAVRSAIRDGKIYKLPTIMESGAADGMWTADRYRRWLDERRTWARPKPPGVAVSGSAASAPETAAPASASNLRELPSLTAHRRSETSRRARVEAETETDAGSAAVLDLSESGALEDIISQLEGR